MSYEKLKSKIREKYKTDGDFAKALGIDRTSLYSKLIDKTDWKREEIEKACNLLEIPIEEVHLFFFTVWVEKTQFKTQPPVI